MRFQVRPEAFTFPGAGGGHLREGVGERFRQQGGQGVHILVGGLLPQDAGQGRVVCDVRLAVRQGKLILKPGHSQLIGFGQAFVQLNGDGVLPGVQVGDGDIGVSADQLFARQLAGEPFQRVQRPGQPQPEIQKTVVHAAHFRRHDPSVRLPPGLSVTRHAQHARSLLMRSSAREPFEQTPTTNYYIIYKAVPASTAANKSAAQLFRAGPSGGGIRL